MGSRLEKNSQAAARRIETHIFANEEGEEYESSRFGGFSDYFRRKKIKLQNLDAEIRSQSPDKPQIFKGVVAAVNGYTQPSLNDLHRLIVTHGGGFVQYLDGKTTATHIIAASLTPKKAIEFKRYRIVKPAWVVDSVAAGKLLPWENYRVIDEGVGQKLLTWQGGRMVSQSNMTQRGYRDQTNTSWYTIQVKDAAEEIEDDEDADMMKSLMPTVNNGASAFMSTQAPRYMMNSPQKPEEIEEGDDASSSESYEFTSSLEDALNAVSTDVVARKTQAPVDGREKEIQENKRDVVHQVEPRNISKDLEPERAASSPRGRKRSWSETISPSKSKPITAEEHNAMLLADPKIRQSSTANPDFLKQFYSESRLHHLSTWKAELKSKFQQMADARPPSQRNSYKRKPGARRYIMHVDFDCFFCAVSLLSAPEYKDKPTVVAHGTGSGSEIASSNYPARAFGVKNGMWMKTAQKLCPEIKVLPYDFPAYEEASRKFYEAILDIGGVVQSVSIDEALVDLTSLCIAVGGSDGFGISEGSIWREQEKADELGRAVREKVKDATGCNVSVGIGGNILLAKVALRKAKPAGQYQIKPEEILDFIGELVVQDLPGVAYSIGGKLEEIGVKFVKDIRNITKDRLMIVLGPKTGEKLWEYSRGIDKTEVGEQTVRKSVSAEVNWGIRFVSQADAEDFVTNLCGELHKRLLHESVKGRQLTMKILRKSPDAPLDPPKHLGCGNCDTFNKSVVLGVATHATDILAKEAISILRAFGFSPGELRGLGVQMTKLEPIKLSGPPDGSQKKIPFTKSVVPRPLRHEIEDPIDDPQTPQKPKPTPSRPRTDIEDIDPDSPQKPRVTPIHPAAAIARANAADPSAKKPLNITGTQFILPTQVDPAVLAELPLDIRSRLLAQGKSNSASRILSRTPSRASSRPVSGSPSKEPTPQPKSRSPSPLPPPVLLPSQLDPEVFDALPDDVKAEVLASYAVRASESRSRQQSLMPQSPRKVKSLTITKKPTTPTKKRTTLFGRGLENKKSGHSTLTQSNFLTGRKAEASKLRDDFSIDADAIDPDFLAAIPEEMRHEVIDEHKRARLAARSGLVAPSKLKKRAPEVQLGQRKLRLPPRPPKPTFTTEDLSALPDLRGTMHHWYREFRNEGPHEDDIRAMERYLRRVILDEKDMAKAVAVVKWLMWLIDDSAGDAFQAEIGEKGWQEALDGMKEHVQQAIAERGIGRVEFGV